MLTTVRALCASAFLAASVGALADEGMWTFENPPLARLESQHRFRATPDWLEHLRLSALHFGGASGSFVSANGLAATNHHVALSCLQRLSSERRDLVRDGFLARSLSEELACPGIELRRLESSVDVTATVLAAARASDPAQANAERKLAIAKLENACAAETHLRCEVDARYRGATYQLLRYKVWNDVRLVFAPEARIGFFGGDTDNFVYPRFDLDVAFVRVYENGAPVRPAHFLKWSRNGVVEGDFVLIAGHPYSTERLITLAQLEAERDVSYPLHIRSAERHRKLLQAFGGASPESSRRAAEVLFGTENWLKAMLGEMRALRDPAIFAARREEEQKLRDAWRARGTAAGEDPWTRIAAATRKQRAIANETWTVGYGWRNMFETAGTIVELVNERALPDGERLPEYRDAALPRLMNRLTAEVPVYKDLDAVRIANGWDEARELIGDDHPFVRAVLGGRSAQDAAAAAVAASSLDKLEARKRLLDGGLAAVNASDDPLIVLARRVYPLRRKLAKMEEVEIDEPIRQAADEIARMRFEAYGTSAYPDATGSLRLGFGVVRGYDADGVLTPWSTNFHGLYARHAAFAGKPPFDLPERWQQRERNLALATPLDFVSTLDIIGGNSGSPIVDRQGELVGLLFDGNLDQLGARFGYSETKARAIGVDARGIVEALRSVYGANELVRELGAD